MPSIVLLETDANAVAAGGSSPGWVSGTPAALAAAATANCLFDLGPNWRDYPIAQVVLNPIGPSSGFSNVQITSRDDAVAANNQNRRLGQISTATANGNAIFAAMTVGTGAAGFTVRPMGRFMVVTLTNADGVNAVGATSKVTVSLSPN